MSPWKQKKHSFLAISAPPIVWLIVFFLIPMGIVWLYSFGQNSGPASIAITGTFSNYARALEPVYLEIFFKSVLIAGLTTLICLILAFPVAMAITFAPSRMKIWLLMLIMLPFWTNLLIRTYALITMLGTRGTINQMLGGAWHWGGQVSTALGLGEWPVYQPLPLLYNNFAVLLGLVYVHLPFMVLPLYAALEKLDRSLIEASLDLGASQWRTITRIIVPLAAPGIVSGLIITFVPALGAFLTPDLMGGADSMMIANVVERQFKRANDWPFGAALSFVLMYATFVLIALQTLKNRSDEKRAEARR